MTRTLATLISVCVGTVLLVSGCEEPMCKDTLNTCQTELAKLQKTSSNQLANLNDAKSQLSQAQAKLQELTKENEELKAGKAGKTSESKKAPESAKKPAGPAKKK